MPAKPRPGVPFIARLRGLSRRSPAFVYLLDNFEDFDRQIGDGRGVHWGKAAEVIGRHAMDRTGKPMHPDRLRRTWTAVRAFVAENPLASGPAQEGPMPGSDAGVRQQPVVVLPGDQPRQRPVISLKGARTRE
jgi:hypothetical protein